MTPMTIRTMEVNFCKKTCRIILIAYLSRIIMSHARAPRTHAAMHTHTKLKHICMNAYHVVHIYVCIYGVCMRSV